ncbi:MAG TPA: hypothetical protein VFW40_11960, partial [Capsulimonadaceae bacterium]|nr:hypothetical protein [Capsulimonadaceae bacterium]
APEPRWMVVIAFLVTALLYAALPKNLTVGPRWLQLVLISCLLIPTSLARHWKQIRLSIILGHLLSAVNTTFMVISLVLLIRALPSGKETATHLLGSAALLWLTNVIVFALWYWRLDAGGPHARSMEVGHTEGAFLFPQMVISQQERDQAGQSAWAPNFLDYLFLAFNTSTALSPTDTAILSRWAKALMMGQASISLSIIALLAGRAVNIL